MVYMYIYICIYVYIYITYLSIFLSIYLSVYLFILIFMYLYIYGDGADGAVLPWPVLSDQPSPEAEFEAPPGLISPEPMAKSEALGNKLRIFRGMKTVLHVWVDADLMGFHGIYLVCYCRYCGWFKKSGTSWELLGFLPKTVKSWD